MVKNQPLLISKRNVLTDEYDRNLTWPDYLVVSKGLTKRIKNLKMKHNIYT